MCRGEPGAEGLRGHKEATKKHKKAGEGTMQFLERGMRSGKPEKENIEGRLKRELPTWGATAASPSSRAQRSCLSCDVGWNHYKFFGAPSVRAQYPSKNSVNGRG